MKRKSQKFRRLTRVQLEGVSVIFADSGQVFLASIISFSRNDHLLDYSDKIKGITMNFTVENLQNGLMGFYIVAAILILAMSIFLYPTMKYGPRDSKARR